MVAESKLFSLTKAVEGVTPPSTAYSFELSFQKPPWYTSRHRLRVLRVVLPPVGRCLTEDVEEPAVEIACVLTEAEKTFLAKYPGMEENTVTLKSHQWAGNHYAFKKEAENVAVTDDLEADVLKYPFLLRLKEPDEVGSKILRRVHAGNINVAGYIRKGVYFSTQHILDGLNRDLNRGGVRHFNLEFDRNNFIRINDARCTAEGGDKGYRNYWSVYLNPRGEERLRRDFLPLLGFRCLDQEQIGLFYGTGDGLGEHSNDLKHAYFTRDLFYKDLRHLELGVEVVPSHGDGAVSLKDTAAIIPLRDYDEARALNTVITNPADLEIPTVEGVGNGDQQLNRLRFTLTSPDRKASFALGSGVIELHIEIYKPDDPVGGEDSWRTGAYVRR
jgi:hypothetical protein